jgi:MoaA/NifB/PqqE/SkfB family radical SAM enzyme
MTNYNPTLENLKSDFSLTEKEKEEIDNQMKRISKDIEKRRFCFEKVIWDNFTKEKGLSNVVMPCTLPYYHVYINPYGDVYPCVINPSSYGNIKNSTLEKLLNSKKGVEIRKSIFNKECTCESTCYAWENLFRWPKFYLWFFKEYLKYLNNVSTRS